MNVRLDCVAPLPALRRTRGRCLMSRAGCTRPITRYTRDTYSLVENCAAASRCTRQHFFFFFFAFENKPQPSPGRNRRAEIATLSTRSWRSLLIKRAAQRLSTVHIRRYIYISYRFLIYFPFSSGINRQLESSLSLSFYVLLLFSAAWSDRTSGDRYARNVSFINCERVKGPGLVHKNSLESRSEGEGASGCSLCVRTQTRVIGRRIVN